MRFKGLDLNLLVALNVLLEEQNVTRAAERMHVGQSAMSAALNRLREHFGDELLTVAGRRMIPTALADAMRQPLRDAIEHIEAVVDVDREFVPATSMRHFRVEMPDHLAPVLLPHVTRVIAAAAPHLILDVQPPSRDPTPFLHKGELDLVITPSIYSHPDYFTEPLLTNELVLLGWSGNPALQSQPDLETVLGLQQVVVRTDRVRLSNLLSEQQLDLYSGGKRTALFAPNFSCIPLCLVGTNRFSLLYKRFAQLSATTLPLVVWKVPLDMPIMSEVTMFNPGRCSDGGLSWLRHVLQSSAAEVLA